MKEIITEVFVNKDTDITLNKIKRRAKELSTPWIVINHLLYDDEGNINVLGSEKIIVSYFKNRNDGIDYIKSKAAERDNNIEINSYGGYHARYIFREKDITFSCLGYMELGIVSSICY